jgi:hypothetical protein
MTATRPRISHAAAALCLVAVLAAAAPALATKVVDRSATAVSAFSTSPPPTPPPNAEEEDGVISGKWFWGGWYGWSCCWSYKYSYYPYYCNYWNYGYGYYGYDGYGYDGKSVGDTNKTVTAEDAALRAAEVRAGDDTSAARVTSAGRSNDDSYGELLAFRRVRASAARRDVANSCAEWLGVTEEQLLEAPPDVAVVEDKCCWPSSCALAVSSGGDDGGVKCCVPDSERIEGC